MRERSEAIGGSGAAKSGPKTTDGKSRSSANAVKHGALSLRPVIGGLETNEAWQSHRRGVFESLAPANHLEETLTERVAIQLWRLGRIVRYETEAIRINQELVAEGRLADGDGLRAQWASSTRTDRAEADRLHAAAVSQFLSDFDSMPDELHLDRDAGVAMIWAGFKAAFENHHEVISIPGIPDEDDEFDAFDAWTPGLLRRAFAAYAQKANITVEQLHSRMVENAEQHYADATEEIEATVRQRDLARHHNLLPSAEILEKITRYEVSIERSLIRTLHELQRLQASRHGLPVPVPMALDVNVSAESADGS